MHQVLVLGAGKIGALICGLLAESGSWEVQLADQDLAATQGVVAAHSSPHLRGFKLDARDAPALQAHLAAHPVDAVISGLPYYCNPTVAAAARRRGGPISITST